MSKLSAPVGHVVLAGAGIVATTVLAGLGTITGTDALGVIIAAIGIGGTGVAAAGPSTTTPTVSPTQAPATAVARPAAVPASA